MRNRTLLGVIGIATALSLITTVLFFKTVEAASGKPIKMTYSDMFPSGHLHGVVSQRYCDEIKNRTQGRVEITIFPAGTLTSPVNCYEGVTKGVSDIGMSSPSYVPGRFPVSDVMLQPLPSYSGWVTSKVTNDLYQKFMADEYKDVHVLYFHGPGPNLIITRRAPVRKLEDLNGMVLRAVGPTANTLVAWGATPRAMPMGESYEAISKGIADGGFNAAETLKGYKLGDVIKYVTIPPVTNVGIMFVVMNKEKWNSLPDDIKKVFTDVSREWVERRGMVWNYIDIEGFEYFKKLAKGREIITIPKDQYPEWQKAVEPVINKFIKDREAKGLPAAEIVDYVTKRSLYWFEKQPSDEVSTKWVQQNLLSR
jgi:TRAP-type C4-dicarboxylate transport system substrate-binding protein